MYASVCVCVRVCVYEANVPVNTTKLNMLFVCFPVCLRPCVYTCVKGVNTCTYACVSQVRRTYLSHLVGGLWGHDAVGEHVVDHLLGGVSQQRLTGGRLHRRLGREVRLHRHHSYTTVVEAPSATQFVNIQ